jgi:hypothetical protein
MIMKRKAILITLCGMLTCLLGGTFASAGQKSSKDYRDAVWQSAKAARVFREIMRAADHAVPRDIMD